MTNLGSRDIITLPTEVCIIKAMFFPLVMYGCESWTIKKAERQRIVAFELWCWRRLESPLDCITKKLLSTIGKVLDLLYFVCLNGIRNIMYNSRIEK